MLRLTIVAMTTMLCVFTFADPVDVFIFSGQSNMVGAAQLDDLPETQRAPVPHARFWAGNGFEDYVPGTTPTGKRPERFGPELAFAATYTNAHPEASIYLIKYAVGGRPLHGGWDNQKWLGEAPGPGRETFYPGEKPGDPNAGTLHQNLLNVVRPALAHLKNAGIDYRVRGILWMQGEADAKHEIPARAYATSLKQWHLRLLEDIGADLCPLVYGQVLPHEPALERFTNRSDVRASQSNLDHGSGHSDSWEWATMVPTEGMGLADDTVHYNAAGQWALGKAFAEAMSTALESK